MSWSARDAESSREFFDTGAAVSRKAAQLAAHLQRARHAIVFTGAGLSTSAGIPDFRSGLGTVLTTGPGLWAAQADYERRNPVRTEATKNDPTRPRVDLDRMLRVEPTFSHRAIAALVGRGYVKCVLTQNVDNLHRRSGVPRASLVELHGNLQCEVCELCGAEYERDFRVGPNGARAHFTGRLCEVQGCGGRLKDYLVPFGEDLPATETRRAWRESELADFCLAVGSSLTVTPACDYAGWVSARTKLRLGGWESAAARAAGGPTGALGIVNLQKTPYDGDADVVVHSFCDDVMREVMKAMDIQLEGD